MEKNIIIEIKILILLSIFVIDFHYIPRLISSDNTLCVYIGIILLVVII